MQDNSYMGQKATETERDYQNVPFARVSTTVRREADGSGDHLLSEAALVPVAQDAGHCRTQARKSRRDYTDTPNSVTPGSRTIAGEHARRFGSGPRQTYLALFSERHKPHLDSLPHPNQLRSKGRRKTVSGTPHWAASIASHQEQLRRKRSICPANATGDQEDEPLAVNKRPRLATADARGGFPPATVACPVAETALGSLRSVSRAEPGGWTASNPFVRDAFGSVDQAVFNNGLDVQPFLRRATSPSNAPKPFLSAKADLVAMRDRATPAGLPYPDVRRRILNPDVDLWASASHTLGRGYTPPARAPWDQKSRQGYEVSDIDGARPPVCSPARLPPDNPSGSSDAAPDTPGSIGAARLSRSEVSTCCSGVRGPSTQWDLSSGLLPDRDVEQIEAAAYSPVGYAYSTEE